MIKYLFHNYFLFILVFAVFPFSASSQNLKTYDSIYQPIPGYEGHAKFTYFLDGEGNRIKSGDFVFTRDVRLLDTETKAIYNYWEGSYADNLKEGPWFYETKNHKVAIEEISDVELDYTIYTEDEILEITYENGIPVEEITLENTLYANKVSQKRLKYFQSGMKDGRMDGEFEFYLANANEEIAAVKGQAQNGLMEGLWEFNFYDTKTLERREYKNGVLLKLTKIIDGQITEEIEFPLSKGIKASLNKEEGALEMANKPLSLSFSDGYPRNSKYLKVQEQGEEILKSIFEEIFKFDGNLNPSEQLPLGTNRAFYPVSSEERSALKNWIIQEADFRNNIQTINSLEIDNPALIHDADLQVYLSWAKKQEEIRDYIKPWNNILSKDQIEFYNREGLLVDYAYNLLSRDTITVDSESVIFNYEPTEKGDNFLLYIVENFTDRNKVADSLIQELTVRLDELQVNREIADLHKEIISMKENLDSLYEIRTQHDQVNYALSKIKTYFSSTAYSQMISEFIDTEDLSEQISLGQDLNLHLDLMKRIYTLGKDVARKEQEIDSLYTELTFDPFTFSDQVPARKKRRLYKIVTEEVIQKLIIAAGNNYREPKEALKNLQQASKMQERLIFLEDKNTSRLERRLARSKSLSERVELLNSL